MASVPLPDNEAARLARPRRLRFPDSPPAPAIEALARAASAALLP
jgi:hypothetical protein